MSGDPSCRRSVTTITAFMQYSGQPFQPAWQGNEKGSQRRLPLYLNHFSNWLIWLSFSSQSWFIQRWKRTRNSRSPW